MAQGNQCEYCAYFTYDEDDEDYFCDLDLDEDDAMRFMTDHHKSCPFFRDGNEYKVVRHQI